MSMPLLSCNINEGDDFKTPDTPTLVSLLQVTMSQPISTGGVVTCHKIGGVAESLRAVLHGNLVACAARGGLWSAFFFLLSSLSDDL